VNKKEEVRQGRKKEGKQKYTIHPAPTTEIYYKDYGLSRNDGININLEHIEGSDVMESFNNADSRRKVIER
jgi:hypothetical protein